MNKLDIMKMVYSTEELRKVDTAISSDLWKSNPPLFHVTDYNNNTFGVTTNLLTKLEEIGKLTGSILKKFISREEVLSHIEERITLNYVDYRSNFNEHLNLIQDLIRTGNYDAINDSTADWFMDSEMDSKDRIKHKMKIELSEKYGIDDEHDAFDTLFESYGVDDVIYERDDSTVFEDMLKNTNNIIAHYDTGYELEPDSWNWTDEKIKKECTKIKEILGIPKDYHGYNPNIQELIREASYGGSLLIYFSLKDNVVDFVKELENNQTIIFEDYMFGIVNHFNGSGGVMPISISKYKYSAELKRENLFLEKSIKYNWTYSIAGMCNDWADDTAVTFAKELSENKIPDSPQTELQLKEEKYNAVFKSGKCSLGDIDVNRHRNMIYINSYPCGNKCTDCGTFLVD